MPAPPPLPPAEIPPPLPGGRARPPAIPKPRGKASVLTKAVWFSAGGLLLAFVVFFCFRLMQFSEALKHRKPAPHDYFSDASHKIGPRGTAASGNTDQAEKMAAAMSKLMLDIRNLGFEQAKEKSILDERDQFKTYCDLRKDQCVFLIHVPEMRRFTQEAQESLGTYAWQSAQAILKQTGEGGEEMKLAVGLMGVVSYERIMTGQVVLDGKETKAGPGIVKRGFACERSLYDWFAPESTNSPPGDAVP